MKRKGPLAATLAALAGGTLALLLSACGSGTPSSSTTASSGASPPCLPGTLEHSAALPGADVDVSPAPATDTANPGTQISFLGVAAAEIREVSVVGSHSGAHSGRLRAYSQGDGASFAPDTPFDAGERVSVSAVIGPARAGTPTSGSASQSTRPIRPEAIPEFPNPPAAPADYQSFDTLPGVQAPILTVTVPDRDPAAGDILTTNGPGPGQYGPLIYTPTGPTRLVRQAVGR